MAWIQKQTVNSCAGNWLLNCVEMCLAIRSLPVYCLWIDGRAFQDDSYHLYDSYRYYIQCMKFYIMYSQSFYIINYFCIKIVLFILFISWWISDVWCWNYISCRNCDVLSINDTSIQGMNVSRSIFSQVMIIRCVR